MDVVESFTMCNRGGDEAGSAKLKYFQVNKTELSRIFKELAEELPEQFMLILNKLWKNGEIPKELKTANIH